MARLAVIVTGSSERSVEATKAALPEIEVLVSDAGNVVATAEASPIQGVSNGYITPPCNRPHRV